MSKSYPTYRTIGLSSTGRTVFLKCMNVNTGPNHVFIKVRYPKKYRGINVLASIFDGRSTLIGHWKQSR